VRHFAGADACLVELDVEILRPPQDDKLFDISKRWWRWLRHQRLVLLVL
jgi:hypothetical protein